MKHIIFALGLLVVAAPAQAACYADYKAKKDSPLRLAYGVTQVSGACSKKSAASALRPKLAADGWTLLNIVGTFDESGLEQRKGAAGDFFLRY
ncbi:hypothetical protein [Donghicola sp. XS_ASV15]|uniref:hypothetical protein n=1 Tax=Donghicola sp. XS_ASV15 TaxID=3241295 RepID=UPI003512AE16